MAFPLTLLKLHQFRHLRKERYAKACVRHGRACPGYRRLSLPGRLKQGVDGRDEPGHHAG